MEDLSPKESKSEGDTERRELALAAFARSQAAYEVVRILYNYGRKKASEDVVSSPSDLNE